MTVLSKVRKCLDVERTEKKEQKGGKAEPRGLTMSSEQPTALSHFSTMSELLCDLKDADELSGILHIWVQKAPTFPSLSAPQ